MSITFKRLGFFMVAMAFIGAPAFSAKAQSYSCGIHSTKNPTVAIGDAWAIESDGRVNKKQGQVVTPQ